MKGMRYAHSDGHTVLCYDDTGRYMLTGGTDGDVRVWQGIDDDDAVSHRIGDRVYAIAFKNNRFYTATESNSVQTHTFPDGAPDGIVTRFTASVNQMSFNKSGTVMVAASSDFTVKYVEVETSSQKVFHGHEAPVLSVALDPREELVASVSCDGSVRVWKVDTQECCKTWPDIIPKCSDVSLSKTLCRLAWSPDGKFLLVPADKEIILFERGTWHRAAIADPSFEQMMSIVAFSPTGKFVATASCDGVVHIIDWHKRKSIDTHRHEKKLGITSLAWKPDCETQLAICDAEGQLGVLDDVLKQAEAMVPDEQQEENPFAGVFDDDDDMLLQASHGGASVEDDAASRDGGEQEMGTKKTVKPLLDDGDDEDDDGDFLKDIKQLPRVEDDDDASSMAESLPPVVVPTISTADIFKPTPLQRPFQPGSTPSHLSNRFMIWNSVGIVKQFVSEDENSIDVEFHSTTTHHAMHLTNSLDCNLADLSDKALVLACPAEDDSPSKVTCMHFGSWDSSKEWTISAPDGEEVQALTIGDGWIAVATDARNVRILSVAGVQRDIFSIPGPAVSLASHGSQLMIVYHAGMGIPGDQCLSVILTSVQGRKKNVLNGSSLPLSPKSTLQWLGFSKEGSPFFMDSAGILRMLNPTFGPSWVQVVDTREQVKGKSDHYWIVGISEQPQQLRCILCKGSRYPPTLPRPAVSVLQFRIPLCEMNTEKSQYEETLLRTQLFAACLGTGRGGNYDFQEALHPATEALMKLFALSARSDREARALEVCEMMSDEHTLHLAIKYATRLKHIQLAERIGELAQRRAALEEEDNSESEGEETTAVNGHEAADSEDEEDMEEDPSHDQEVEETEQNSEMTSGPRLNLQSKEVQPSRVKKSVLSRSNPFKVASQQSASHPTKGSQVFDKIPSKPDKSDKVLAPLPVSIRTNKAGNTKKIKTISNMFGKNTGTKSSSNPEAETENSPTDCNKPVTGFQLWYDDHRTELEEEHPDLGEDDLGQVAAERYRAIPKEERQSWSRKAKGDNLTERKRKRSTEEEDDKSSNKMSKKPLTQSTNTKLSSFAFSKD